jgi:hemoglobin
MTADNLNKNTPSYGQGDSSFQAAGGFDGIKQLVDAFYDAMETLPEAKTIKAMHSKDLTESRDKLTRFLCGWLGGPKLFSEKYGPIRIPVAHRHLEIGPAERDAWLTCMQVALDAQPYAQDFRDYLMAQLYVPAERSRNKD